MDREQVGERISPAEHPKPTGYAHAVKAGGVVYVSGQAALDVQRRLVGPGDIRAQTRQALDNVANVLAASGATWANVVRLTMYLTDIRLLDAVREVRAAYYAEQGIEPPATTSVGVTGLSVQGALVEVEATAVLA